MSSHVLSNRPFISDDDDDDGIEGYLTKVVSADARSMHGLSLHRFKLFLSYTKRLRPVTYGPGPSKQQDYIP